MGVGYLFLPRLRAEAEAKRLGYVGRPVGVHERGRLIALNAEAEEAGLAVGMRLRETHVITHDVLLIQAQEDRYLPCWREVLDVCAGHLSIIEPAEVGRAFFDTAGPWQPEEILGNIRTTVEHATGFTCITGGGPNKLVARIAAEVAPGHFVHPDTAQRFLAPLPLSYLWLADQADLEHLQALGVRTFELLQEVNTLSLTEHFGARAERLKEWARGIDLTPVEALYPPRWVEARLVFEDGTCDSLRVEAGLKRLACDLSIQLLGRGESCRRLSLSIDGEEHPRRERAVPLKAPCYREGDLEIHLRRLVRDMGIEGKIIALEACGHDLCRTAHTQLDLFARRLPGSRRRAQAQEVVAHAQARFGDTSVVLGATVEIPRRERVLTGYTPSPPGRGLG